MELIFRTPAEAWAVLYDDLANNDRKHNIGDFFQSSPRGRLCNETIDLSLKILEPAQCLIWNKTRSLSPIYLAKEFSWYLNGSRELKDIPSKVWENLANKEGIEKDLVNSNYGHWLFVKKDNKNPNLSVWEATIELFKKDKDTRQAIVQIPIMKYRQYSDTPCTSSIHFILRDGKLYSSVYMRSCDAFFGAPNDWTQFIMWQMMLAKELDVELGWFRYIAGSYHVYEENFIKDFDTYKQTMNEDYITGIEGISYWKFYDNRDYRDILDELLFDFITLNENLRKDILNNNMLKNDQLKYMLENMEVKKFIH